MLSKLCGENVRNVKVVLGGYPRCPDNHDLSKCHRLYDLGRHIEQPYTLPLRPLMAAKNHLPPISLTVSTLTPKIIREKPHSTILRGD